MAVLLSSVIVQLKRVFYADEHTVHLISASLLYDQQLQIVIN